GGVANREQEDAEGDGVGDACEGRQNSDYDTDGDGIPDLKDNCWLISNPDQIDIDKDFVGDECDNCPAAANFPGADGVQDADACKAIADGDDDGVADSVD